MKDEISLRLSSAEKAMKRYILRRPLDRFTKGADITEHYELSELERWAKDGLVIIEEKPDPTPEAVEEESIVATPTIDVPVEAVAEPKRKRK